MAEYSSICVDHADRVHVAYEIAGWQHPDIYYTTRFGDTWALPVRVSLSSSDDGLPAIDADSRGRLHLCWRLRGDSDQIVYSRRDTAWTQPVRLAAYPRRVDNPSLAVGADDRVHLVFSGNAATNAADIYYMHLSRDTWSSPLNISNTNLQQSIGATIAVDSVGHLYVAWREVTPERWYRLRCRQYDRGWLPIEQLASDTAEYPSSPRLVSPVTERGVDLFWREAAMERARLDFARPGLYYLKLSPLVGAVAEKPAARAPRTGARPNPFRHVARIEAGYEAGDAVVIDAAGRVVRRLRPQRKGQVAAYEGDGRDVGGRDVGRGVYVIQMRTDDEVRRISIVKQ